MSMENKEKRKKMRFKIFFGQARDDKVLICCFSKFLLWDHLTKKAFVLFGQSDAANSKTVLWPVPYGLPYPAFLQGKENIDVILIGICRKWVINVLENRIIPSL